MEFMSGSITDLIGAGFALGGVVSIIAILSGYAVSKALGLVDDK